MIYALVDMVATSVVLNGGNPDYVALLPSGFSILSVGLVVAATTSSVNGCITADAACSTSGSLSNVTFQILVDTVPTTKLS
ncbi:kinesin-like protein KIF19-like [Hibiscus syriacus]|uniref:Kinesin-like protein KIF19-like n=1 Tax=Hibiscus syriacus TaxID=106335 RepID=A0A6A3A437_HIBSY|nr:kinesin-like protein KIF19-like [Hibiscus syriacus]